MNTTIEALQGLYTKLGGDIEDVKDITIIPEMITAIENLPSISAIEIDSNDRTVLANESGVLVQAGNDGSILINDRGITILAGTSQVISITGGEIQLKATQSSISVDDDDFTSKTLKDAIQQVIDEQ